MNRLLASALRQIRPVFWPVCLLLSGGQWLAAGEPWPVQGLPCPQSLGIPFERGCVFADLDGDGKPDTALIGAPGRQAGTRITISIHLSGSSREQTFSFDNSQSGSGIHVRDLDGDHDLDLVLTQGDRRPATVLLNDGNGSFTIDPDGQYLLADDDDAEPSGWTETPEPERLLPAEALRTTPLADLANTTQDERLVCRSLRLPAKRSPQHPSHPWNSARIRAP